ncbi:membrane protein [Yersinia entomophaga]|uniref:Membrane protein n=1 Tax=Yersinia entomophaga TaxID=935293 RepID=A0ABM6BKC5_YERET|nr:MULTISPECIES: cell envelope integrity protein CreD [Yersinia]ANI29958.1 membrane protein [Yersinia entomophaga]OWF87413.1 cell envelope integrity protein CreD [Yersinia entomophaga]
MFKSVLFWKITTLLGLILLMMIPKEMLMSVISERSNYRYSVISKVTDSTSGAQKILGPLIVVPYSEMVTVEKEGVKREEKVSRFHYLLPETLSVTGSPDVDVRQLGIYRTQVYQGPLHFSAKFDSENLDYLNRPGITFGKPILVVRLSDARGIQKLSPLKINGDAMDFQPGAYLGAGSQGIHAMLDLHRLQQGETTVDFTLTLMGTSSLSLVPLGRSSELTLESNWPHPNFLGDFLPNQRRVGANGFQAHWSSTWFANNLNVIFATDEVPFDFDALPAFSTSLIEPVNHYQLTQRAIKYAILFIGLTFISFFLFESLTSLRLHPIQYLLVGIALILFYLMLLALSEHIGFALAYLVASLSCSLLIVVYLGAVLGSWLRGGLFAGSLLLLYGVLYGLLQSEDNALLLGSGLLFVVLAVVMLLTRRLDWYQLADPQRRVAKKPADERHEIPPPGCAGSEHFRLWK